MCRTISAPSFTIDAKLLEGPCPMNEVTPEVNSSGEFRTCKLEAQLGLEELREHFFKLRGEAAQCLQISVNCLKAVCRRAGVERWPFRKLQSLVSLTQGDRLAPQEQASIQAEIEQVLANPNHEVSSKLVKMKLTRYKERYKERMMGGGTMQASRPRTAKRKVIKSQSNRVCNPESGARVRGAPGDRLFQGPAHGSQDAEEGEKDASTQAQSRGSADQAMLLKGRMGPQRPLLPAKADSAALQQQQQQQQQLQQPPGECGLMLCAGTLLSSTGEPSSPEPSWASRLFNPHHAPQPAPLHAHVFPSLDGSSASAQGAVSNEGLRQQTPLLQPPPLHDLLDALDQVQGPPGLDEFESAFFMPDSISRGIDALFDNGISMGLV
ncbi:hypothetical protein DUNSADRAFT_16746 [Dunaliella salina]|uniref:RWP-RK domain-containing protein n=1 Tax=Dunaliella salina TaxID=3046 RepID=A0ABQ7G2Y4_DUNSA|nr:hypothetical protein DUNSADRAFT_16746 [Dunaliella salina]|eukprot:KAF5828966.1 hypothetical protein DUNSADRAFT_16746 [Dunaliella salina]